MTGYPTWPELFRWLTVLKDRVEQLPSISAEQVITGTLDPSVIPPIPWDLVLKAGSSLGDLETRSAGDLSSGTLLDARMPALTGDVSSVAGTVATTLATVNLSPGSYGSGTLVPIVTVNEKGLITDVMTQPIVLVPGGYTVGDLLYANSLTTLAELHDVAVGSYLRSGGVATAPLWSTLKLPNAVTAGSVVFASATDTYGQDNAHLFWDDTNNRLGLGTTTPQWPFHIVGAVAAIERIGSGPAQWTMFRANGTQVSPTAVTADGSLLGELGAYAYDGTNYQNTGYIRWTLDGTASVGSYPGKIGFFNTPSGATVSVLQMLLDSNGRLGIGVTPTAVLHPKAGTAAASTAPLKFNSGTLLATAEAGAVEFLTDAYYGTITTGASRKTFAFLESPLFTGVAGFGAGATPSVFTMIEAYAAGAPEVALSSGRSANGSNIGDWGWYALNGSSAKIEYAYVNGKILTNTAGAESGQIQFRTLVAGVDTLTAIITGGKVGVGSVSAPTARLHLPAGTATANTAPLKFTSGTNLTTAEAGAVEYDGTDLFFTRAGTVRENVLVAIDNVAAPTTSIGVAIVNFYGANATNYLGDPNRWLSVNVLGATYKIPLYT